MVTGTNSNSTMSSTATSMATSTGPAEMATSTTTRRLSDNRRSNKPIMEKRRRARINNCLNELKTLILDAMKKDPARHSKLEKADILEMTVKHLQTLQRQQVAMSAATDPTIVNKFRAGFNECASEVGKFPGLDPIIKRRLLQHLANCLNAQNNNNNTKAVTEIPQVQVHILPNTATAAPVKLIDHPQNGGIILSNGNGVQLVPTRLPNGDIALVLPNTNTPPAQQVPLLVPIMPERTSSTASAASTSSYSPSHSPEPMLDNNFNQRKPLSLVVRKDVEMEEKPWRPW